MIRIQQIRIPVFEVCPGGAADVEAATGDWLPDTKKRQQRLLWKQAARLLKCQTKDIRKLRVLRRSTDARDRQEILFVYTVSVRLHDSVVGPTAETERRYIERLRNRNITQETRQPLQIPMVEAADSAGENAEQETIVPDAADTPQRPVIVGSGPCGLFAALALAEAGIPPIILERGAKVEDRMAVTERFFTSGRLDADCNIQFGEGGAGTFSDGKLNTGIKDQGGYIEYVLRSFVRFGADEGILYDHKPHIGTDVLAEVIRRMREYIISRGGEYRFHSRMDGLETEPSRGSRLSAVYYTDLTRGKRERIPCSELILAIGHSARDTYEMLSGAGIHLEAKAFAVGVRIQHPQNLIDRAMYGSDRLSDKQAVLGPSPYKLTHRASNGRSVYSFCMCPGGYVVNSSSEDKRLCINGMSYHRRDSGVANAALIVNITPEDYAPDAAAEMNTDPLAGIRFQRRLEELAYACCGGVIPYETLAEFRRGELQPTGYTTDNEGLLQADGKVSEGSAEDWDGFSPQFLGYAGAADVRRILPEYVTKALEDGMHAFGRTIPGYDDKRAILAGIEARTSSPVRILRGEERLGQKAISPDLNSPEVSYETLEGFYPAGEGAGYAGGITSAAVDGLRTALCLIEKHLQHTS